MAARETLKLIALFPDPARFHVLGYLSCFRPAAKALNWKKAFAVVTELSELVRENTVSWEHSALPCSVKMWADGMEAVAGKPDLTRPLKNHNLLRSIVSSLAKNSANKRENEEEEARRYRGQMNRGSGETENQGETRMSAEEWKRQKGIESLVGKIGKDL